MANIRDQFIDYAGESKFEKFVRVLVDSAQPRGRLMYWQETLWKRFGCEKGLTLPTEFEEIRKIFVADADKLVSGRETQKLASEREARELLAEWETKRKRDAAPHDNEDQLFQNVDEGIDAAYSYYPMSVYASGLEKHFGPCKSALQRLAAIGSEKAIDKVAYVVIQCIRDGYHYSGIRKIAEDALRTSDSPFAKFYVALMEENTGRCKQLITQYPFLRLKAKALAENYVDPWESPSCLLAVVGTAGLVRWY